MSYGIARRRGTISLVACAYEVTNEPVHKCCDLRTRLEQRRQWSTLIPLPFPLPAINNQVR